MTQTDSANEFIYFFFFATSCMNTFIDELATAMVMAAEEKAVAQKATVTPTWLDG